MWFQCNIISRKTMPSVWRESWKNVFHFEKYASIDANHGILIFLMLQILLWSIKHASTNEGLKCYFDLTNHILWQMLTRRDGDLTSLSISFIMAPIKKNNFLVCWTIQWNCACYGLSSFDIHSNIMCHDKFQRNVEKKIKSACGSEA